jgi:hypothetical protein
MGFKQDLEELKSNVRELMLAICDVLRIMEVTDCLCRDKWLCPRCVIIRLIKKIK